MISANTIIITSITPLSEVEHITRWALKFFGPGPLRCCLASECGSWILVTTSRERVVGASVYSEELEIRSCQRCPSARLLQAG